MAKKESTFLNMLLTLFLVTLGASAALGYVYELTKDAVAAAEKAKNNSAIMRVLPEYNNSPADEVLAVPSESEGDSLYFYVARKDSDIVGYAIKTFSKNAFSGEMKLMVGFYENGTIKDIAVLEHKETPGLGNKIQKAVSDWSNQFNEKDPASFKLSVVKDGGDVDAITASTISSRAYCDAVDRAYKALNEFKMKGDQ